jgi:hypothetical protein
VFKLVKYYRNPLPRQKLYRSQTPRSHRCWLLHRLQSHGSEHRAAALHPTPLMRSGEMRRYLTKIRKLLCVIRTGSSKCRNCRSDQVPGHLRKKGSAAPFSIRRVTMHCSGNFSCGRSDRAQWTRSMRVVEMRCSENSCNGTNVNRATSRNEIRPRQRRARAACARARQYEAGRGSLGGLVGSQWIFVLAVLVLAFHWLTGFPRWGRRGARGGRIGKLLPMNDRDD